MGSANNKTLTKNKKIHISTHFFLSLLTDRNRRGERPNSRSHLFHPKPPKFFHIYSTQVWRGIKITTKKLNCLICLAKGMTSIETAKTLGISQSTLYSHLNALRWRLKFSSKKEMIDALRSSEFGQSIKSLKISS